MEACEPLRGYSWLVDAIRRHNKACGDLGEAVERALSEMPDDFFDQGVPGWGQGGGEGNGHLWEVRSVVLGEVRRGE